MSMTGEVNYIWYRLRHAVVFTSINRSRNMNNLFSLLIIKNCRLQPGQWPADRVSPTRAALPRTILEYADNTEPRKKSRCKPLQTFCKNNSAMSRNFINFSGQGRGQSRRGHSLLETCKLPQSGPFNEILFQSEICRCILNLYDALVTRYAPAGPKRWT